MQIEDHLSDQQKKQINKLRSKKKRHRKKQEKLSERDLAELMGVNRDTYRRSRGGAIRRK